MVKLKEKWSSLDKKKLFFNGLFIFVGSVLIAFGTVIFLKKLTIISGGLAGLGILINVLVNEAFPAFNFDITDIIVFVLTWVLWVIGFFVIGKEFALKTLFSSIVYPIAISIFVRVSVFDDLASKICSDTSTGNILLCGVFGGTFVGGGVALTFVGGGSSGGVDIIYFIIEKYLKIKQSISSFFIDAIIIVLGMTLIKDNLINGLCGIISAFICALMIEYIYIGSQTSYQVDIISEKYEEISKYAQDELGRGATIIPAIGGYKGEQRPILRIVFDKTQFNKIKNYIAKVDPHAFITFTQTNAVYGEGFKKYSSKEEKNVKNDK
ncbi:MAG: YitT family protein [Bacilli bacterium]